MCLCFSSREECPKALKRPLTFTEPAQLSETLHLIQTRTAKGKGLRLYTPDTVETLADITYIANQGAEVSISGTTFLIHRPEPCLYVWRTQGAFLCETQQVCCRIEFQFLYEGKEYRLLKTNCFKNEYAAYLVERDTGMVSLRKVVNINKISKWSERFQLDFAEELSHELVSCFAYFLMVSRALDR